MSSSTTTDNRRNVHFETTPRAYYDNYTAATPSYDLYPSLARRMSNGYVHRPSTSVNTSALPRRPSRQVNFATMNMIVQQDTDSSPLWYSPHPLLDLFSRLPPSTTAAANRDEPPHQADDLPPWDLYPLVLRNVENLGTDEMRRRLHRTMTTML